MFGPKATPYDRLIGRRVLVAFLAIATTYAVAYLVEVPAVQIPGYMLIVSFATLVSASGLNLTGIVFDVSFALYLYVLAVAAASATRVIGRPSRHANLDAIAGALLVLGVIGVFVAVILAIAIPNAAVCTTAGCNPVDSIDWSPVFIVFGTGLVLIGGGVSVAYRRRYA